MLYWISLRESLGQCKCILHVGGLSLMYDQRMNYSGLTMATGFFAFTPIKWWNSFLLPWNVGWPCDLLRPKECHRCDAVSNQAFKRTGSFRFLPLKSQLPRGREAVKLGDHVERGLGEEKPLWMSLLSPCRMQPPEWASRGPPGAGSHPVETPQTQNQEK